MISVSIIIPVYRVEKYIERCIRSVINQTCKDIRIECIVVDDCTPDNSIMIVKKIIDSYVGGIEFKIIQHEKNEGLSAARNTGMNHAKGDYLMFIDSDDYITDDCLEKLLHVIEQYPDVEVIKGNHMGREKINISRIPKTMIDKDTLLELFYLSYIPCMAWNTLIKRSLISKWGLAFRPGLLFEDNLWSFHLFHHTDYFVFVADQTYFYEELNDNAITGNKTNVPNVAKIIPNYVIILEEQLKSFDSRHEVSFTLYIVARLMMLIDMVTSNNQIDVTMREKVFCLRNSLVKISLSHLRLILIVFELLNYWPFHRLTRLSLFRRNYHKMQTAVNCLAHKSDFLHRKNYHI